MEILVLTKRAGEPAAGGLLPALELLPYPVTYANAREAEAVLTHGRRSTTILVDAREELVAARALCRALRSRNVAASIFAVLTEGGLAAISPDWGVDDILLTTAGPGEIAARLRIVSPPDGSEENETIRVGDVVIDPNTYLVRVRGRPLDLTYKEFELLKYLAQQPGRVFTREQLLREVWGYDYFGGTRTVDVHIRRLRAKLGSEHESMIGTVRQVGYRIVSSPVRPSPSPDNERKQL